METASPASDPAAYRSDVFAVAKEQYFEVKLDRSGWPDTGTMELRVYMSFDNQKSWVITNTWTVDCADKLAADGSKRVTEMIRVWWNAPDLIKFPTPTHVKHEIDWPAPVAVAPQEKVA